MGKSRVGFAWRVECILPGVFLYRSQKLWIFLILSIEPLATDLPVGISDLSISIDAVNVL
jgi:hypothetical protein